MYIYVKMYVYIKINTYHQISNQKLFSIYIYKGIIKKAKGKSNKSQKTTSQNPPKTSKAENSPKPPRIWLSGAVQEWGATTTNKRVLCRTAASWGGDMSVHVLSNFAALPSDEFSKEVVDFSSIRGPKIFGWMLIFKLF